MKTVVNLQVSFRSMVETFLEEFVGLPGIEIKVVRPTVYEIKVTNPTGLSYRITDKIFFLKTGEGIWEFSHNHHDNVNSSQYIPKVTICQCNESLLQNKYVENDLLKLFLKSLYTHINSYNIADPLNKDRFTLSSAYLNMGVRMGILLCGERRLVTDCHFHSEEEGLIIFQNTLVATDMVHEYDNMKGELISLRELVEVQSERIKDLENKEIDHNVIMDIEEEQTNNDDDISDVVDMCQPINIFNRDAFNTEVSKIIKHASELEANEQSMKDGVMG